MNTTELVVGGMTCGHCQSAVTKALKSVPGVQDAQVDLSSGGATVSWAPASGTPDTQALLAAVVEEGYTAQLAAR